MAICNLKVTVFVMGSFLLAPICNAQEIDIFIGGKVKRNYSSQDEVILAENNIPDYSKELLSFNTLDVNVEAGIIYRPKQNFFVEGRFTYGSDTYKYLSSSDLANLGFVGSYTGLPLGPLFLESNGFFSFSVNSGYTINQDKFLLDIGAGLVWQPAYTDGDYQMGIGIYYNNEQRNVANMKFFQTQATHIYQNVYARLFIQNSKHKLFNHVGFELGYTNKLIGRFRKSIMDVTYTDSKDRTFVNKHYDFQRSLAFSVLYRF